MKTSFRIRAAAMVASIATTFLLVHGVALTGHPAVAPDSEAGQLAAAPARAQAS